MSSSSRSRSPEARITSVRSPDAFALRRLGGGNLINFATLAEFSEMRRPSFHTHIMAHGHSEDWSNATIRCLNAPQSCARSI
jgi:hypothetical protein